jgi:hypothetical protein
MQVDDFMSQLGLVLRLPAKPKTPALPPAQTATKHRVPRTRLWIPAVAVMSSLLFAASQLRFVPHVALPQKIVGSWQTSDPRYTGRQLVLTGTTVYQTDTSGESSSPRPSPICRWCHGGHNGHRDPTSG